MEVLCVEAEGSPCCLGSLGVGTAIQIEATEGGSVEVITSVRRLSLKSGRVGQGGT